MPDYLGDGVYATTDQINRLWLTTGTHEISNADAAICLEPEVIVALVGYLKRNNLMPQ